MGSMIVKKPKRAIILISWVSLDTSMRQLAYHNDLIYLDIVHPYESDPTWDILFSGQVMNISSYLQEYMSEKQILRDTLRQIWASYIACSTARDISDTLNTFFKNRYHHG
jgi:hypothetical protein